MARDLPDVVAAMLIFVVAALVSGAVGAVVTKLRGDTPTGKVVATIVPALVRVIALARRAGRVSWWRNRSRAARNVWAS